MNAKLQPRAALDLKLELLGTGLPWSVIGWHFGPFREVHPFVMVFPANVLEVLAEAETIVQKHFPCPLCQALGYSPERLRQDLQHVLVVQ